MPLPTADRTAARGKHPHINAFSTSVTGMVGAAAMYLGGEEAGKKVSVMTGKWELAETAVEGCDTLATTSYGKIYRSQLPDAAKRFKDNVRGDPDELNQDGSAPVVVKQLKQSAGATHPQIKEFFREVEILKEMVHPNLLALYGVISHPSEEGVAMSMVLEGPGKGNLKHVLDTARMAGHADKSLIYDSFSAPGQADIVASPAGRLRLMLGAGRALEFLHGKRVVLRDMAARNCIVSAGGEIRVGDYGMHLEDFEHDYVKLKGKKAGEVGYPVRWMAPESLQDASVWTIETDVWTWGVTAWEIASLGLRPHSDVADPAVAGHVIGGARLPTGRLDIADNVSTAITQAFEPVPELRPTVEQVVAEVEAALARLGGSGGRGANGSPASPPKYVTAADMGQGQPSAGLYEIPVAAQQTSGELYDVSKNVVSREGSATGELVPTPAAEVYGTHSMFVQDPDVLSSDSPLTQLPPSAGGGEIPGPGASGTFVSHEPGRGGPTLGDILGRESQRPSASPLAFKTETPELYDTREPAPDGGYGMSPEPAPNGGYGMTPVPPVEEGPPPALPVRSQSNQSEQSVQSVQSHGERAVYEYDAEILRPSVEPTYAEPEPVRDSTYEVPVGVGGGDAGAYNTFRAPQGTGGAALADDTYDTPDPPRLADDTYDIPEAAPNGPSPTETDSTYEIPEPFNPSGHAPPGQAGSQAASRGSHSTYHTPEAHPSYDNSQSGARTVPQDIVRRPGYEDSEATYDNPGVEQPPAPPHRASYDFLGGPKDPDVDLFDSAVPTRAGAPTSNYGLKQEEPAEGDVKALEKLLTMYGGKEDAPGSNDNSDDEAALQPVPLVIETISGGGGGAEGEVKKEATVAAAPPLTGDDATLQRYREAYKTKPEMYTKKVGKANLTVKLRRACKKGYYESVEKILTWPDVMVDGARKGGSGKTALHIVANKGYLKILDMLIARGANPFVEDGSGKIPLDYAQAQRFGKAIEKLKTAMLERGRDLSGEAAPAAPADSTPTPAEAEGEGSDPPAKQS